MGFLTRFPRFETPYYKQAHCWGFKVSGLGYGVNHPDQDLWGFKGLLISEHRSLNETCTASVRLIIVLIILHQWPIIQYEYQHCCRTEVCMVSCKLFSLLPIPWYCKSVVTHTELWLAGLLLFKILFWCSPWPFKSSFWSTTWFWSHKVVLWLFLFCILHHGLRCLKISQLIMALKLFLNDGPEQQSQRLEGFSSIPRSTRFSLWCSGSWMEGVSSCNFGQCGHHKSSYFVCLRFDFRIYMWVHFDYWVVKPKVLKKKRKEHHTCLIYWPWN